MLNAEAFRSIKGKAMKTIKILIIIVALLTPFASSIAGKTAHAAFHSCAQLPKPSIETVGSSEIFDILYGTKLESLEAPVQFVISKLTPGTIYGYKITYSSTVFSSTSATDLKIFGTWFFLDGSGIEHALSSGSVLEGYPNPDDGGATLVQDVIYKINTIDASKRDAFGVPTVDMGSYIIDVKCEIEYAEL